MGKRISVLIAVVLLWGAGIAQAATLEDYAQPPLYQHVTLSPDGNHLAFVTIVDKERRVIIQDLADPSQTVLLPADEQNVRDLGWAGNGHLLIITSGALYRVLQRPVRPAAEMSVLQIYDLRRKVVFLPLLRVGYSRNRMSGPPQVRTVDGKTMVYLPGTTNSSASPYTFPALFRIDPEQQTTTLADVAGAEKQVSQLQWLVDTKGELAVQTYYDERKQRWSLSIRRQGKWKETLTDKVALDIPFVMGLGPDEGNVILQRKEAGRTVRRSVSIRDGALGAVLPDDKYGGSYLIDRVTHSVIGFVQNDARRRYVFSNEAEQREWDQLVQSYPNEELRIESWSSDRKKMVVQVFGNKTGAGYILVDFVTKRTRYLENLYRGIEASDIGRLLAIRYPAADGLSIEAYLTLPNDRSAKALPLVVLPHDGPTIRDRFEFHWLAQALASRGYAVLQPNYRGSSGYGDEFQERGFGQVGRKMQTDLSDGVRHLVDKGLVDAKRVCVTGVGYGGYAALAGAAFEDGVYRCAIAIAGISDLRRMPAVMNRDATLKDGRAARHLMRFLGATSEKDPSITTITPALHADRISIPVQLIHGTDDREVPIEQSEIMAAALERHDKPVELVKLEHEDHRLSHGETRTILLQSMVKFLETHNPP